MPVIIYWHNNRPTPIIQPIGAQMTAESAATKVSGHFGIIFWFQKQNII